MKNITPLEVQILQTTRIGAAFCIVIGVVTFAVVDIAAQSPKSPATRVNTSKRLNRVPTSPLNLLLVFHGVAQIGEPRSAAAVITDTAISNVHDITFTRGSGELSPDGRWIAYDCSGFKRGIHVAKPDGSNAKLTVPLTDPSCVNIRWSPDSMKLSYTGAHNQAIRVYDLATDKVTLIPNTERAGLHWWSPAGNEIVYEKMGPSDSMGATGRLLFITDLKGNSQQLTFAKDFASCAWEGNWIHTWAPAWSKTNKIAFTQCGALFMISPSGKDLRQLTTYPQAASTSMYPMAAAYSPRWSPDGRWIIFSDGMPCRIVEGALLKRISPNDNTVLDIGTLPYCGGPFSVAPLRP